LPVSGGVRRESLVELPPPGLGGPELEVLLTAADLVARAAVDFDYQGRRVIGS
jgi:hypothetical protein